MVSVGSAARWPALAQARASERVACKVPMSLVKRASKGRQEMSRIAIAIALALLSIECHAQSGPSTDQCDQIRAAIAQYGLQAARKHAMENYGVSNARRRDGCSARSVGESDRRCGLMALSGQIDCAR